MDKSGRVSPRRVEEQELTPLNNKTIGTLSKIVRQGTQACPLYAVEYENSIVVTNKSWLMEWPKELVDIGCSKLAQLFDNQNHKLASLKHIPGKYWTEAMFDDTGKYENVKEAEPEGALQDDKVFVRHRKEHIQYDWVNFEATEMVLPDAEYMLYKQPERQGIHHTLRILVVYDGKRKVGAFTNDCP